MSFADSEPKPLYNKPLFTLTDSSKNVQPSKASSKRHNNGKLKSCGTKPRIRKLISIIVAICRIGQVGLAQAGLGPVGDRVPAAFPTGPDGPSEASRAQLCLPLALRQSRYPQLMFKMWILLHFCNFDQKSFQSLSGSLRCATNHMQKKFWENSNYIPSYGHCQGPVGEEGKLAMEAGDFGDGGLLKISFPGSLWHI